MLQMRRLREHMTTSNGVFNCNINNTDEAIWPEEQVFYKYQIASLLRRKQIVNV